MGPPKNWGSFNRERPGCELKSLNGGITNTCNMMKTKPTYLVIVNPVGGNGKGRDIYESVRGPLEAAGIELEARETEYGAHAVDLVRSMDLDGIDGVISVGGDGTLHEIINGLMTRPDGKRVPVGAIPGGSGNSFLYGFDILTPEDAVNALLKGERRSIDLAKVHFGEEDLYSFNIIGWGLVVDIELTSEKFRWWARQRYNLATVWELLKMNIRHTRLVLDGEELDTTVAFLIACNTPYTGVGMKMAPRADLGDGKIDVIVVREATRMQMLKLFPRVFDGSHIESELVDYYQVKSFQLIPDRVDTVNIDGELNAVTPLEVEVLPQVLEILF
ncbi:MAG: diacylglycerol kinase family lipid kinase [Candidatus Neomarinimicrobiota bacterium]|nr:MAG: diacylglycerol kinase family lipid kinase [Candidatus Neomarinimicrobiota bacterium]